ncbi:nuclear hormone receptor HR96 [Anopheles coustani]|uniref:nuclear hormone receptor HR96 n=1 Tax=Anopheles coustani TaxID=139045 RepID=UPI002657F094|nr:nuclear hormone receptor HR96 [Anopheles coustani]
MTTVENEAAVPDGEPSMASSSGGGSKICSVCGDKALGYNFNAVTCESCKAFFRRNALSTKGFTCPFNEKCEITVVTRRFCQKCRLEKCFQIGMKKEYIMSEEDKVLKRKKIEQNRAKKRLSNGTLSEGAEVGPGEHETYGNNARPAAGVPTKIKREKSLEMFDSGDCWNNSSSSEYGVSNELLAGNGTTSNSSSTTILGPPSNCSSQSIVSNGTMGGYSQLASPSEVNAIPSSSLTAEGELLSSAVASLRSCASATSSSKVGETHTRPKPGGSAEESLPPVTIESSAEDIVERIVKHPNQTITSLMKTPKEAVFIMSKIINSQCDALKLISHFITAPSDALQILSKIMNSPLDALTVFTQFMSSPTDALQLIGKVISSPGEVLQFMQQLMNQPEDAVQIMKKFMDSPAEALQMINRMMNHSDIVKTIKEAADTSQIDDDDQQRGDIVSIPTESHPPEESGPNQHQMIRSLIQESNPMPEQAVGKSSISAAASPSSTSNYEPSYGSLLDPLLSSTTTSYTHSHHLAGGIQPASPPSCSTDMLAEVFSTSTSSTFVGHDSPSPIVPAADELGIFQDIEAKPVLPNTLESVLMQAIKLEYEGYNSSPIGSSTGPQAQSHHHLQAPGNNSIELNDAERAKLNELIVANKALYAPVDDDLASLISDDCRIKSNQTQQDPQLLKVINLTAIAIRRLIKMSKKISAFKNMCQEDQLALLKGGCTEMMILRSAMQYDCDRATWRIPHSQEEMSNIRADVLKLAKGNVYQEHERFIRTFDKKWRSDENIILIMCAITLFTPDRPKTIHSDVIKLEQNSYYYLLRRYLESIYPGCEARSVFLKLMQKISELHRLNDEIISVYLNVNPAEVEPLLREIFDLKVR